MSVEQPQLHQNLSNNTVENKSQGFFGTAQTVNFGSVASPEEESQKKAEACRNALFISNLDADREELISAKGIRVPGTCEWIKKNKNFRALQKGKTSLLWITGGPGKGKTMLSIFITEDLEQMYPDNKEGDMIYHFCVHKKRDTGTALLRGLLYQILDKRRELTKDVLSYFETPAKTQQALSSLETLWVIFLKLIKHPKLGVILCLLDGLDECDEDTRGFLLPRFAHHFGSSQPASRTHFRLIVVSRALEGLEDCKKIDLDNDPGSRGRRDIQLFVREKVDELFRTKKFDDSFRPTVQSALLSKAGDTFLWVGFVVDDLLKLRTWSQVQEQLKSLPDGLSSIYGRMLLEIPSKERETALFTLRSVCLARRPLSLLELAEMRALPQRVPGSITFKGPRKVPEIVILKQNAKDAVGLCGQILKLKDEKVTFVHKSARDYLLRKEKEQSEVLRLFKFRRKKSHLLLAKVCFQSIAQSHLGTSTIDQDEQLPLEISPFLKYAIQYWPEHVQRCCNTAKDLFDDFCSLFESNQNLRKNWWNHYLSSPRGSPTIPLLHMVSFLGIKPWIEALLQRKPTIPDFVNEEDEQGMRPIEWASKGKKEEAVEVLLAHKACINDTRWDRSLVSTAISWSNQRILRMLSERGADFNVKNSFGQSGLHIAFDFRSEMEIFKLLVERGADLDSRDKEGCTPIHRAVRLGNEEMVLFLIEAGANVMIKDRRLGTVLRAACYSNMERVVRKLLRMGLDVKVKDKFKNTMLHVVAREPLQRKFQPLVRLLISKGLDVQAKNCHGSTPLHLAAASGNFAVVQLLIEHGADVNAKNRFGNMPLHSALMYRGYGESARLLISSGADVNAPDDGGYIPLRDCIQKHESRWPTIDLQAQVTHCVCVRWEGRERIELVQSGLSKISNPFE